MLRINYKPWIYATVVCIVGIYILIDRFYEGGNIFANVSKTVTIYGIIFFIFTKWLWKNKWIVKFMPFPYLGGNWEGELNSTYPGTQPIHLSVTIKHGLFHSYLTFKTKESKSLSNSFAFNIDEETGIRQIIYTYQNTPKSTERNHSNIHWGSAVLDIVDSGTSLEGNYWTDRGTIGTIVLRKVKS